MKTGFPVELMAMADLRGSFADSYFAGISKGGQGFTISNLPPQKKLGSI